jgi:outer membrane protein assembly factor BamB
MSRARRVLASLALSIAACDEPATETPRAADCVAPLDPLAFTDFHGDSRKLGWNWSEPDLTPARVQSGAFGEVWTSDPFDEIVVDGTEYAAHAYASPLFVDGVEIGAGPHAGSRASLVFVATSNGFVYAVNAFDPGAECGVPVGTTVWRRQISQARPLSRLDGGVPMGVLGTPTIDLHADPPRIYVGALDAEAGWQIHALGLGDGEPLPGWPVDLDPATIERMNTNGPARFLDPLAYSQRGGLVRSPAGDRVYAAFGTFQGEGVGWIVAVDTQSPGVVASFSSAPWSEARSAGGMWGSSGPTVADDGHVWVTTGNGPPEAVDTARHYSSSLLELDPDLALRRAYTPSNYCVLDAANMDLGASQPLLLPPISGTSTPDLVAFGGKQGTVYLVDRDGLARAGQHRPACRTDMRGDRSLHPPGDQPQYDGPGPLSVFGPYSEEYGQIDHAKMRTKLAFFHDHEGTWLFASGSSKESESSTQSVPPSLAKLRVASSEGEPAWLEIAALEPTVTFFNPGPPVVTSNGVDDAIVWVLDANAPRTASLVDPDTSGPVLWAFDARDLRPLWTSGPLPRAGKYGAPLVAHGLVFVATDRLHAFGLREAER